MMDTLTCHVKYAIIVLISATAIIMLSKWTGRQAPPGFVNAPSLGDVQRVVDGAARSNSESHKTHDSVRALVDVTTALTALKTTTALVGEDPVMNAAGVSPVVLEAELRGHQASLLNQLEGPLYS